jgi:hypothetical protein
LKIWTSRQATHDGLAVVSISIFTTSRAGVELSTVGPPC